MGQVGQTEQDCRVTLITTVLEGCVLTISDS